MKKSGKNLEKLVRIVEEVYQTDSNTQILSNHKIENLDENLREIDLLIKSVVNDFEIIIAIECKEYSRKVSVEKIEAFNSKCLRIPNINKKILISEKGFQKDAIAAANAFGIELYSFSEIEANSFEILGFAIKQLKPRLAKYNLTGIKFEKPLNQETIIDSNSIFRTELDGQDLDFFQTFQLYAKPNWGMIMKHAMFSWMKEKTEENEITLEIKYENLFLIYKKENIKIDSISWSAVVKFDFVEVKTNVREILNLKTNKTKAKTLSFTLNDEAEGSIVVDKNNDLHIFDTTDNQSHKLGLLFSYNPKTDKIEYPKE